ncbi:MAG: MFS transporter permease [Desulfobacterales bacterium]|nr:MFS transporter permease [Desulfobacterales bacterium]
MGSEKKVNVIPRENAVFRMDKNGIWHNEHGRFEHPKIISYFNRSIQKDDQGYFLSQTLDGMVEKVYFPYEDTAVFVVDIRVEKNIDLILNTGTKCPLAPDTLFIKDDNLYCRIPDHLVKFNQHALAKMAVHLDETEHGLVLCLGESSRVIPEK